MEGLGEGDGSLGGSGRVMRSWEDGGKNNQESSKTISDRVMCLKPVCFKP